MTKFLLIQHHVAMGAWTPADVRHHYDYQTSLDAELAAAGELVETQALSGLAHLVIGNGVTGVGPVGEDPPGGGPVGGSPTGDGPAGGGPVDEGLAGEGLMGGGSVGGGSVGEGSVGGGLVGEGLVGEGLVGEGSVDGGLVGGGSAVGGLVGAMPVLAGYRIVDVESEECALRIAARASAAPGPGGVPLRQPIDVRRLLTP
jgi:hypothetical protein